jgi:hypothetical protein
METPSPAAKRMAWNIRLEHAGAAKVREKSEESQLSFQ